MSEFSKTLKKHISEQNIPIHFLSKSSGMERTSLQHMLTGKYVPANVEAVEKVINAMTLSPMQREELLHLYHIARIGEDVYRRHQYIKTILESVNTLNQPAVPIYNTSYNHVFPFSSAANAITGIHNVNSVIKAVLEAECSANSGFIKFIIQPEYSFLLDLLLTIGNGNPALPIEHVFCMHQDTDAAPDQLYNLQCLKQIFPLMLSGCNYNPAVYYDNVDSHINNTSVFPYLILTSDKVVCISYDLSYATLYLDPAVHSLYQTQFTHLQHLCRAIVTKIEDPMSLFLQLADYEQKNLKRNAPSFAYSLFTQPCFLYCADRYLYDKYMYPMPGKNEIVDLYAARSTLYFDAIKNGYVYTSYFTLEGLDEFWRTGRINELPDDFYSPLEPDDRLLLIERIIDLAAGSPFQTIAINLDQMDVPSNFIMSALVENMLIFFYVHPQKGFMHFVFNELSIIKSFSSFISYLKNSEMVIPAEETLQLLREKLRQYQQELAQAAAQSKTPGFAALSTRCQAL
ncbi:hypothetical protein HNQ56_004106 [Anaerotaenia torta]|uniref:hypothetical protein n=1 Tax=Anaerotaenia torta TaxID=433293 RepID=UPI003D19D511